jgi:hypothetical protein
MGFEITLSIHSGHVVFFVEGIYGQKKVKDLNEKIVRPKVGLEPIIS